MKIYTKFNLILCYNFTVLSFCVVVVVVVVVCRMYNAQYNLRFVYNININMYIPTCNMICE